MAHTAWMLELGMTGWQWFVDRDGECALIASEAFADGELLTQIEPITAAITAAEYAGEPIVVALHSSWCLTSTLPMERPGELRDRTTMGYRLEESMPWGAEDFVADYAAANGGALAVAVRRVPLVQFLDLLEQRGIQIQSIVPLAVLAATAHFARGTWPDRHAVAFAHADQIDLVWTDESSIISWQSFSAIGNGLPHELRRQGIETGQPISLVEYRLASQQGDNGGQIEFVQPVPHPDGADQVGAIDLAMSAAGQMVHGTLESPIDLQRHARGRRGGNPALRKYARAFQVAAAVLLACAIGAMVNRSNAVRRQSLEVTSQQADMFHTVFPNAKVPVGIATRLRSELAKLQGLRGDDGTLPEPTSAIVVLERLFKAMPIDKRFRLLEIRVEEGRLYLDGETRAHSDAESIAQRLRGEGFSVSPPKSQRLDDQRVSLRITGKMSNGDQELARKQ